MNTGPAFPLTRPSLLKRLMNAIDPDYSGLGAWAYDSKSIPLFAWIGGAAFVAGFIGFFWYAYLVIYRGF